MSDDTYNGWTNRETWAINLHLSNNEGDYRMMCEHAESIVKDEMDDSDGDWGDFEHRTATGLMADYIKEWTEEVFAIVCDPEDNSMASPDARNFVADVGSWWRADFYEIASHWIDDAREAVAS